MINEDVNNSIDSLNVYAFIKKYLKKMSDYYDVYTLSDMSKLSVDNLRDIISIPYSKLEIPDSQMETAVDVALKRVLFELHKRNIYLSGEIAMSGLEETIAKTPISRLRIPNYFIIALNDENIYSVLDFKLNREDLVRKLNDKELARIESSIQNIKPRM